MMKEMSSCLLLLLVPLAAVLMTSSATFVVETHVYVDEYAVKLWQKLTGKGLKTDMETEVEAMMAEVGDIINQGTKGLGIKLLVKEIDFLEEIVTTPSLDGFIDANYGLGEFTYWLDAKEKKNQDLSLLLTGSTLTFAIPSAALGISNIAAICHGSKSVAMIHLKPTMQDTLVIAHEIGHVLGARHDGDGNNCNPKDEYLMIYSTLLTDRRYQFSTCSWTSIRDTLYRLDTDQQNCLLDHQDEKQPDVPEFGSLLTADILCKSEHGSRSFLDREVYSGKYGDDVCLKLACRSVHWKTKQSTTRYIPSPDGLYCGKNKQCVRGKCVVTSHGLSTVSDTCPFGDQPYLNSTFPQACGQIESSECHKWKDVCCDTCNEKNPEFGKTADDACRQLEGKTSQMLRSYNASTYHKICGKLMCLKDVPLIGLKFQWNKYTAPNGMACGKNKRCQDGECVVTSSDGNPDLKNYCPFGDQPWLGGRYQTACDGVIWRNGCKNWGGLCCETCQGHR